MAFSLGTILTIMVLLTCVIKGSSDAGNWTITPSDTFAIAEKDFNLTCKTGYHATDFFSWYRNGDLIRHYTTNCEYKLTNQNLKYDFHCTSMTTFTVVIPATVIDDEHGSQWYCSGDKSVKPIVVNVLYEPDRNLTLTGYDGSILRPEQNLTLFCHSNGGRPLANLSWSCGGTPMQGLNYNSSNSKLSLRLNESLSGQECTCTAMHPIWETPVEINTFPLQVYYASNEAPLITGYESFQGLREGERLNLTCTVLGGYPIPSLSWICGDMVMDTLNKSTEGIARIVLPLSINRTFHEQQCVCNGSSPANYSGTSNVSFIVSYPPTVTFISKKRQFQNGTNYIIFCKVDEGNPTNYDIRWSQVFANTVVRTNTDLSNLLSNNRHNLTLKGISYRDIGEYRCSVHNNVTDLHGILLQTKNVSIERNFSAVFASSKVFQAIYGRIFDVKIPFYCQPPVKRIGDLIWLKKDKNETLNDYKSNLTFTFEPTAMLIPFYKKHVRVDGQVAVMMMKVTSYTLEGKYELRVRNMESVYESFEFEIKVKDQTKDDTFVEGTKQKDDVEIIIGCVVAGKKDNKGK
ncbi:hypothetical protein KUTeg_006470 [Tegillarca granosa]|uniref:Ig-like domain-containing protein n=1 Tax=Tegillarca granosa TaxID=220873 RepID=A0ABQ9FIH6_TEGGR|nr:hypothetical protein KUTeg_006470 [Tegillarca granosa]